MLKTAVEVPPDNVLQLLRALGNEDSFAGAMGWERCPRHPTSGLWHRYLGDYKKAAQLGAKFGFEVQESDLTYHQGIPAFWIRF